MAPPELGVWLDGEHIGTLTATTAGRLRFRYTDHALDQWPGNTPLVSCSLPVSSRTMDGGPFFEGLLPEGGFRDRMAALAGVVSSDAFGLLRAYGRDIAGALVVSRTDVGHRPGDVIELTETDLATEIGGLEDRPLGVHDDSELSLAGLQDKMLLVDLGDGRWGRPTHGRPSTHILKIDHRVHRGLVVAEHECLAIARAAGLAAADSRLVQIGSADGIVVARFDRLQERDDVGGVVTRRVHQEDSCQALALGPRQKYEIRQGGGGPELSQIATVLDRYATDPREEMEALVRAVTFRVLIGDADAHGKNVSFLHQPDGTIRLAPLYDTVPTVLWPSLNADAAMTVDGMVNLAAMTPDTVAAEAHRWGVNREAARSTAVEVAERVWTVVTDGSVDTRDELRDRLLARVAQFRNERPE